MKLTGPNVEQIAYYGRKAITQSRSRLTVFLDEKLEYIHNNPVEAGFVNEPDEYLYSSARNYAGKETAMNIDLL